MIFFPNPIKEWDTNKYFMIKLLDVILDKLDGLEINIHQRKNIKYLQEIKETFYEENPYGR